MSSRAVIDKINNNPIWLSEPGAYPVMFVCSGAVIGAGCYICYKFLSSPDVRWDKNKRGSVVRWWGRKELPIEIASNN